MRRNQKEILDQDTIEQLIKNATILRLGLTDGMTPYVVPLNYGYKDNTFYIHCALEGRKLDLIEKNPTVCFEIEGKQELVTGDVACDWTLKFESVIGYGIAHIIETKEEKLEGLAVLMSQFSDRKDFNFSDRVVDRIKIIKIDITQKNGKSSFQ